MNENLNNAQAEPFDADCFLMSQLRQWPIAADNFKALEGVKVKDLDVDGLHVKVQFNPARIVSSAAKVDKASLQARPCFLCEKNRPAEQVNHIWDRYEVLVNPFPIFPRHFTIPDREHTPQLIKGRIADMVELARLMEGYTVFYNGPRCGASAPDHMHFQAGNSDFLTIGATMRLADVHPAVVDGDSYLAPIKVGPLNMFAIDAVDSAAAERLFTRLYNALPVPDGEDEPMMNILAWHRHNGKSRIVVVPRKRHRPSFYGTEGEGTMLLSPASVDMGGVFITPLEKDFEALDADTVTKIFDELCFSPDDIKDTLRRMQRRS